MSKCLIARAWRGAEEFQQVRIQLGIPESIECSIGRLLERFDKYEIPRMERVEHVIRSSSGEIATGLYAAHREFTLSIKCSVSGIRITRDGEVTENWVGEWAGIAAPPAVEFLLTKIVVEENDYRFHVDDFGERYR